ncbi:MAG: hypothetical protein IJ246_03020 [Clostridia bacterium]|nr:hypothetical protein [Lachnospiraceae bacterium]MBQ9324723.1 hypothetical protein [Clostridia bacterium]
MRELHDTAELRQILEEHPDLPLLIYCETDEDMVFCPHMSVELCEFLKDATPIEGEDILFTDKDEFREAVEMYLEDQLTEDMDPQAFAARVDEIVSEYEPRWLPGILLSVWD